MFQKHYFLLGRDPIEVNLEDIMGYVTDKVVMVTGGGGSIGSELCRQIAASKPKQLIIVDIYENNAYDIQLELKEKYHDLKSEIWTLPFNNSYIPGNFLIRHFVSLQIFKTSASSFLSAEGIATKISSMPNFSAASAILSLPP